VACGILVSVARFALEELGEDKSYKRTYRGARAVIGWPGSSVEALCTVFVVDADQPSPDDPERARTSQAWVTGLPRRLGRPGSGLRSPGEAGAQPIPAAP